MAAANGKSPAREARNARRREERAAAKAAKANGTVEAPAPPADVPLASGVFVVVDRAPDGAGITNVAALPNGDVRPAEILTILETAVKVTRANLGL